MKTEEGKIIETKKKLLRKILLILPPSLKISTRRNRSIIQNFIKWII